MQHNSKQARYQKIRKLGEGSYGSVTKVFDHETQTVKALKKIKFTVEDEGMPINALREISALKRIQHENVVKQYLKVFRVFQVGYSWEPPKLYIALEFVEENLYEHMKRNHPLSPYTIKSYAHQSLSALAHLHLHSLAHRDIKPQNVMITPSGTVKLCDFGQSRLMSINKLDYSLDIATLWYKAPEVLLGCEDYGFGVDVWAMACVIVEMMVGAPLFKSDCQIGQIFQIFRGLGTVRKEMFPKWKYLSNQFPQFPVKRLKINNIDPIALDLLGKMLQIDPNKRISCCQALKHQYFEGY